MQAIIERGRGQLWPANPFEGRDTSAEWHCNPTSKDSMPAEVSNSIKEALFLRPAVSGWFG